MSAQAWRFAVYPGGKTGRASPPPGREYQELWFRLARLPWASLVIVPADRGTSASEIATSLAEVATSLRDTAVTAIVADQMDYGSARALAELQPRLANGAAFGTTIEVRARDTSSASPPSSGTTNAATALPPTGRAIVAIRAVVDEPLGIAIAHAADAVLLCVEMGRSRAGAARRTTELIGADRIVGAVVVR